MSLSIKERFKKAWNAFSNRDPTEEYVYDYGMSYSYKPDRFQLSPGNERTIIASIYTRIAIDVSSLNFQHIRTDQNGSFIETIPSTLNDCLTVEANKDQSGTDFIRDVVFSLLDEGSVAMVPIDTDIDPEKTDSYSILSIRTGQILEWAPDDVRVRVYNDNTGYKEDLWISKRKCGIIENPLYSVMNEPNSTLQRLIHKLNLLDTMDDKNSSAKLDLIIQLPYAVKSKLRRNEANERLKDIEFQLQSSKYGIAYIDATERVTQLNRPVENTLQTQIEYLFNMLYFQLGLSENVLNGTASEQELMNYYTRTVGPIAKAITDAMIRSFLTKTARTQMQTIRAFRDPFGYVSVSDLANILNVFKRNEIITSNEARSVIGFKQKNDPRADELRNSNITARDDQLPTSTTEDEVTDQQSDE